MKCRKCGAILIESDTFCSECGEKVSNDKCPSCGEILRPGVKFCSNCGYKLNNNSAYSKELEDDEIPITGQMKTADIPIDVIEKNILLEAERQVIEEEKKKYESRPLPHDDYEYDDDDIYTQEEYYDEDEDEYSDDDYYDDEYYSDDEYYEEDDYDEESGEKSLISRLFTAGMIVLGLVIVLIIAALFFNNREKGNPDENVVTTETDSENNESSNTTEESFIDVPSTVGTITVVKEANIRDYPSTENSNVIATGKVGETFEYYGYSENSSKWVHIKLNDTTDGYIYIELISINE